MNFLLLLLLSFAMPFSASAKGIEVFNSPSSCIDTNKSECGDSLERSLQSSEVNITVDHAISGDTFLSDQGPIRLWGIEAPDSKSPYSFTSKLFLETLIKQGPLTCRPQTSILSTTVMHCFIEKMDIGSMMIQMGMATQFVVDSEDYYGYEEDLAKAEKRGIWNAAEASMP